VLQGGAHWIERASDPPERLKQVARDNAQRLVQAGILWARDVGAPSVDGKALNVEMREELKHKPGQPSIRAAGTWVAKTGYLEPLTLSARDGAQLKQQALNQLDQGADFVKIMLDPPAGESGTPFTVSEVRALAEAVHARGKKITAHATFLDGVRTAAEARIDSVEHGFEIDDSVAQLMARNNVALVTTLSVLASWEGFAHTTRVERFTGAEGRRRIQQRKEGAYAALRAAHKAGVRIATGSDFGGGSVRAGHLAWEIELLVQGGLEPWEALAAATWRGGEVLGEPFAGRVVEQAPADFVLIHGDPLSDPSACWRVWSVYQSGTRIA
jgi:imidazolonepropionase-like amidohydrolase